MRRQSRELAMQVLFQSEFATHLTPSQMQELFPESYEHSVLQYAELLTKGVLEHREKIDSLITSVSRHWSLPRMSGVDRNVLRVAVFEMKFMQPPLTDKIVIDEAVEIAKKYGTSDSSAFVNGLLDTISKGL